MLKLLTRSEAFPLYPTLAGQLAQQQRTEHANYLEMIGEEETPEGAKALRDIMEKIFLPCADLLGWEKNTEVWLPELVMAATETTAATFLHATAKGLAAIASVINTDGILMLARALALPWLEMAARPSRESVKAADELKTMGIDEQFRGVIVAHGAELVRV